MLQRRSYCRRGLTLSEIFAISLTFRSDGFLGCPFSRCFSISHIVLLLSFPGFILATLQVLFASGCYHFLGSGFLLRCSCFLHSIPLFYILLVLQPDLAFFLFARRFTFLECLASPQSIDPNIPSFFGFFPLL